MPGFYNHGPGRNGVLRMGSGAIDGKGRGVEQLCQLPGAQAAVGPGDCRREIHMISGVHHRSRGGVGAVDPQPGGLGGFPVKDPGLAVHLDRQRFSAAPQQVGIGIAVHHQELHGGQTAAAEELGGCPVEQDLTAVTDQAQSR